MNNVFFEEESEVVRDTSDEKARLTRLVEAINSLLQTNEWHIIEELHFTKEEDRINRLLLSESKKTPLNDQEIYRLQGELKWATRYASLTTWAKLLHQQIKHL